MHPSTTLPPHLTGALPDFAANIARGPRESLAGSGSKAAPGQYRGPPDQDGFGLARMPPPASRGRLREIFFRVKERASGSRTVRGSDSRSDGGLYRPSSFGKQSAFFHFDPAPRPVFPLNMIGIPPRLLTDRRRRSRMRAAAAADSSHRPWRRGLARPLPGPEPAHRRVPPDSVSYEHGLQPARAKIIRPGSPISPGPQLIRRPCRTPPTLSISRHQGSYRPRSVVLIAFSFPGLLFFSRVDPALGPALSLAEMPGARSWVIPGRSKAGGLRASGRSGWCIARFRPGPPDGARGNCHAARAPQGKPRYFREVSIMDMGYCRPAGVLVTGGCRGGRALGNRACFAQGARKVLCCDVRMDEGR